eukprot:TRINITY_DN2688_c0_g1_i1.p1 TRINITY_DN2688_c0_g1~~TRINITY_DN2688_c0_g1_i1.p1  ORF type:complete len:432 (-),score=123.70 TRINITY_DN2688_c0_g1_i1:16-1311(-)
MGSDVSSSNDHASIKLQCESNLCIAGEEFKGSVEIRAKKTFVVKSILVEVGGTEYARIDDQRNNEKFFNDFIPLDLPNNQGIVKAGKYSLPFYFRVPVNFPCSVPDFTTDEGKGRVEYYCKAKLEMSEEEPIEDGAKLKVVQAPKVTEPVVLSQVKAIKGWFGSDKGVAEIEVIVPKTELYSGEHISLNVNLNCENCQLKVKRVKCKLYEKTVIAKIKGDFDTKHMDKFKVMKAYLPGVEPKKKVSYVETIAIPTKLEDRVLESINGQYIKRSYVLVLVPVFDIVGGDNMMSVETGLTLSSLTVDRMPQLQKPPANPANFHNEPMPMMPGMPMMQQMPQMQEMPQPVPPHMQMMPQVPDLGPQIPIQPEPMVSAYMMESAPYHNQFVQADGEQIPVGQPAQYNPNLPLYPSFDSYVPPPVQNNVQQLYPQL